MIAHIALILATLVAAVGCGYLGLLVNRHARRPDQWDEDLFRSHQPRSPHERGGSPHV